jgi:hypothetical protein
VGRCKRQSPGDRLAARFQLKLSTQLPVVRSAALRKFSSGSALGQERTLGGGQAMSALLLKQTHCSTCA